MVFDVTGADSNLLRTGASSTCVPIAGSRWQIVQRRGATLSYCLDGL